MQQHKIKILISGGGTGGHIFPAIAIANAIKNKHPEAEILFVGAKGKMEMIKVPEAGYPIKGIWISGIHRKLTLKNLLFPVKVLVSLFAASRIIKQFDPDAAVGVGGYASGPALKEASRKRIKTLIQEQNSYPGITNKLLAKNVDKICVAYEGMERFFPAEKIKITGNPVRSNVIDIEGKNEEAMKYFDLESKKKTLLIIGGSQGALSINRAVSGLLPRFSIPQLQVIWQTGTTYFETAISEVRKSNMDNIKVHDFITRMDLAYSASDVVISRAGAIAIAELCAVKKPSVFIPFPHAAEDHQTKNAMALVEKEAAIMIEDSAAAEELGNIILDLINDPERCKLMSENIGKLAHKNAAEIIADEILDLIAKDKTGK